MQTAVERRPGSKVALTVTVGPEVLQERMEQLFQKRARKIAIPGFRPGKAPRRMLEERINFNLLQQEAVETLIDDTYKAALSAESLEPLERGEIEDVTIADDKALTYVVQVSVRPDITLPEYTGITVKKPVTQVSDEQVETEINNLRERTADFVEITDDGIQTGDYVTIDYAMSVDGQPYPEGDTTGYPLEVGTDTFFPELNEGLLGVKQGETTTLTTTYPEDYSNKDLAGKTASFEITVQQVRRLVKSEATDEWASTISQGALTTLDALRERIKSNLQAMASQSDRDQVRNELVRNLVDGAELDLPETLVEEELEHLMHEFEHRLGSQRMSLEEYAETMNQTTDDIRNEQQLMARDMVRRSLVLQEVARREKILVTDEDVNEALAGFTQEGQSVRELRTSLEKSGRLDSLVSRIFHEKVLSFLESQANIEVEGEIPEQQPESPAEPPAEEKTEDAG